MTAGRPLACGWLVLIAAVAGCGDGPPVAPSDPASVLAGIWSGTAVDSVAGQTAFRLVLTEQNDRIAGTWTVTLSAGSAAIGSVSATASSIPIVFTLSCVPGGIGALTATRDGTRLTGTYFFVGCAGLGEGTVDVTKQ